MALPLSWVAPCLPLGLPLSQLPLQSTPLYNDRICRIRLRLWYTWKIVDHMEMSWWCDCLGSLHLRLYLQNQGCIFWPEIMSFSWFHSGSIISSGIHSGMFDHTWHSGCSSAWSLKMTTVLGKAPLCVSTIVYYKLRITTALACLCVHSLWTCPSRVSLRVGVALS